MKLLCFVTKAMRSWGSIGKLNCGLLIEQLRKEPKQKCADIWSRKINCQTKAVSVLEKRWAEEGLWPGTPKFLGGAESFLSKLPRL